MSLLYKYKLNAWTIFKHFFDNCINIQFSY